MYDRIYLGGTFDCLHRGHLNLFSQAGKVARRVVVGLNTDEFATRYKRKPVIPFDDRFAVLNVCRLVDEVVTNTGCEDSKPSILRSRADVIGHGDDWTGSGLMVQMGLTAEWLHEHNIRLVYLSYTKGVSTSRILERAAESLTGRQGSS